MGRSHARLLSSIWTDRDFLALAPMAQRLYMLLVSQPDVNQAGVMPFRTRRWATLGRGDSIESIEEALAELEQRRYVVVDRDTEELLVRTFIRNDGVWRQPNVFRASMRAVRGTLSRTLRRTLRDEVLRLPLGELAATVRQKVHAEINALVSDLPSDLGASPPEGFGEPLGEGFGEGFREPLRVTQGVGEGVGGTSSVRSTERSSSSETASPPSDAVEVIEVRPEVEKLCQHLADRVAANGSKRPVITKSWRDAARLLIDKDGRTAEQVMNAIDWCQADEFWRTNVLSMPTLRKQYDRLRLAAKRQPTNGRAGHTPFQNPENADAYKEWPAS